MRHLGVTRVKYIGDRDYLLTELRAIQIYDKVLLSKGDEIIIPTALAKGVLHRKTLFEKIDMNKPNKLDADKPQNSDDEQNLLNQDSLSLKKK